MMKFRLLHLAACLAFVFKASICLGQSDLVFAKGYDFSFEESLELYDHSIKERKELAKTDPSKHYFFIGENYRTGINADKDLKKAKRFFEKSAESDKRGTKWTALAYYHLALLKLYDSESPKGKDIEMLSLLQKAADQECPQAAFNLGMANYLGNDNLGITKNWSLAERFLSKSRDKRAYQNLSQMHSKPGIYYGLVARVKKFRHYAHLGNSTAFFCSEMENYMSLDKFKTSIQKYPEYFEISQFPAFTNKTIDDTDKNLHHLSSMNVDSIFCNSVEPGMRSKIIEELVISLFNQKTVFNDSRQYIDLKKRLQASCSGKDPLIWTEISASIQSLFESHCQELTSLKECYHSMKILQDDSPSLLTVETDKMHERLKSLIPKCGDRDSLGWLIGDTKYRYPEIANLCQQGIIELDWVKAKKINSRAGYDDFIAMYPESEMAKKKKLEMFDDQQLLTANSLQSLFEIAQGLPNQREIEYWILYRIKDVSSTANKSFRDYERGHFAWNHLRVMGNSYRELLSTRTELKHVYYKYDYANVYEGEIVLRFDGEKAKMTNIHNMFDKDVVYTIDDVHIFLKWFFSFDFDPELAADYVTHVYKPPLNEISRCSFESNFLYDDFTGTPSDKYDVQVVPFDERITTESNLQTIAKRLLAVVTFSAITGVYLKATGGGMEESVECYSLIRKQPYNHKTDSFIKYEIECFNGETRIVEQDPRTDKYVKLIRYKTQFTTSEFDEAARIKCECD